MEKCGIKLGLKGSASNTTTYRAFPLRRGQGVPTNSAIFLQKKIRKGDERYPPIPLKKIRKRTGILGSKTLFFALFHIILVIFGPFYDLFGPF